MGEEKPTATSRKTGITGNKGLKRSMRPAASSVSLYKDVKRTKLKVSLNSMTAPRLSKWLSPFSSPCLIFTDNASNAFCNPS
jgi:hypothetical protein